MRFSALFTLLHVVCAAVLVVQPSAAHSASAAAHTRASGGLDTFSLPDETEPPVGLAYTYAIAVDAGSSGSRLSVYRWTVREFDTLPPPLTQPIAENILPKDIRKTTPGINNSTGRANLANILKGANSYLTKHGIHVPQASLFLKATAGLRILTSAEREEAITETRKLLAASGFRFQDNWARVIAGEEEGVFGWITVNFWKNTLLGDATTETWGALDMGGASTQITVVPKGELLANLYDLRLDTTFDRKLYTHSFLYYGLDQAKYRINAAVVSNSADPAAKTVSNPCYLSGTPDVTSHSDPSITFTGAGDFSQCQKYASQLMMKGALCLTNPGTPSTQPSTCSINGVYQPTLAGMKFVAFSGYAYLYDFLGIPADSDIGLVQTKIKALCGMTWAEALAAYPNAGVQFLRDYCLTGTYIVTLLLEGYGLPAVNSGLWVPPLNSTHTWSYSLGGIFSDANSLEWTYNGTQTTVHGGSDTFKTPFIIVAVVAGVLFAAFLALVLARRRKAPRGATELDGYAYASA